VARQAPYLATRAAVTAAAIPAVAVTASQSAVPGGDPDAGVRVAALYEAHARTIVGLCRFLLRDAAEAEDAAQQTFLSAYRSLLGGVIPREPAAWLAVIARNECWARIKRRMREPLALHEIPAQLADPIDAAARSADLQALRVGLESLSQAQREAFMLREFAGLSYADLACTLGITEPAVDSLLFRARTRLRRVLESVNALLVPVALRDQLARLIPGFDQPATGTIAKLASLPIAAKLAAAGASAVLVVAGTAGLGRGHQQLRRAAAAPVHLLRHDVGANRSPVQPSGRVSVPLPRPSALSPSAGLQARVAPNVSERPAKQSPSRPAAGSRVRSAPEPVGYEPDLRPAEAPADVPLPTATEGGFVPVSPPPAEPTTDVPTVSLSADDGSSTSPAHVEQESQNSGSTTSESPDAAEPPQPSGPPEPSDPPQTAPSGSPAD
jgi:RNA polymerase sigma-70 factor (ECF subfamily)